MSPGPNDPPKRQDFLVFGQPSIGDAEIAEVTDTLRSGWIGTGPKVSRFEEAFRDYLGCEHAIAVNSCTAALHLSLLGAGVGKGDEVITTPHTFAATANVIVHTGARPVFIDVDRRTQNIDPDLIADLVTPRTKAILPVHFAGRPCEMDPILDIAERHGLAVIEDAAHCIEGRYRDRKVGTIGRATCFSFYPTKNITTIEGGIIATDDDQLAEYAKTASLHGLSKDAWSRYSSQGYRHYEATVPGFKYNMTDVQASIGLHQLDRINRWHRRRSEIWDHYRDAFADLPVGLPDGELTAGSVHGLHLFTLILDIDELERSRDEVLQELHAQNIGCGVHYVGVHLHRFYRDTYGLQPSDFPNATYLADRTLSIPLSGSLTDEDVEDVVEAVRHTLGG